MISTSSFAGKTELGHYVPTDFYANCTGNRDSFFSKELDERSEDGTEIYKECCHWRPQLYKESHVDTRSGRTSESELKSIVQYTHQHDIRRKYKELPRNHLPISGGGVTKPRVTSKQAKPVDLSINEELSINSNQNSRSGNRDFSKMKYTYPALRLTRSPLFWVLKWTRGLEKPSNYAKKNCLCKCKETMNNFTCINPWHYR
jgi:hypothetical protein